MCRDAGRKEWFVWCRWGRVGEIGSTAELGPFKAEDDAGTAFSKKFRDKTGNKWAVCQLLVFVLVLVLVGGDGDGGGGCDGGSGGSGGGDHGGAVVVVVTIGTVCPSVYIPIRTSVRRSVCLSVGR